LSKLQAHAGISLGIALWIQPAVSAYSADQALSLTDDNNRALELTTGARSIDILSSHAHEGHISGYH